MGRNRFIFIIVKRENAIALIHIVESKDSLSDCSLTLFTGCTGFVPVQNMIDNVDRENEENKLNNISKFIADLDIKHIVVSSTHDIGCTTALLIFVSLCKKLNIYTISITPKPFTFQGKKALSMHNDILDLINTDEVYDSLILDDAKNKDIEEASKNLGITQFFKVYQDEYNNFALEKYNSFLKLA